MPYEPSNVAKGAAEALRRVLPLELDVPDVLLDALRRLEAQEADAGSNLLFFHAKDSAQRT